VVVGLFTSLGPIPGGGKMPGGQSMYPEESTNGIEFVSLETLDSLHCSCCGGGKPGRSRVEGKGGETHVGVARN